MVCAWSAQGNAANVDTLPAMDHTLSLTQYGHSENNILLRWGGLQIPGGDTPYSTSSNPKHATISASTIMFLWLCDVDTWNLVLIIYTIWPQWPSPSSLQSKWSKYPSWARKLYHSDLLLKPIPSGLFLNSSLPTDLSQNMCHKIQLFWWFAKFICSNILPYLALLMFYRIQPFWCSAKSKPSDILQNSICLRFCWI